MQNIMRKHFRRDACHINFTGMIVGASIFVLIQVLLFFVVGLPVGSFHYFRGFLPLLPRWMYVLLGLLTRAILGAALGAVLCDRRYACEIQKYRGAFYFLLATIAGYLCYVFFFGVGFFLVSFVLAAMELFGLLIAMLNFSRVIKLSAVFSALGCLWAIYHCSLSFFSFFVV